ncbi:unnamed protein product [Ranitomeya imitator]|uniref:Uncharacterized protein n=1 Tax=Ranitomeya imitator TaxID=111125 RepID=A0ABN9L947_9NEOB|nr:unnamed protein product [Ranitomeya imitator]
MRDTDVYLTSGKGVRRMQHVAFFEASIMCNHPHADDCDGVRQNNALLSMVTQAYARTCSIRMFTFNEFVLEVIHHLLIASPIKGSVDTARSLLSGLCECEHQPDILSAAPVLSALGPAGAILVLPLDYRLYLTVGNSRSSQVEVNLHRVVSLKLLRRKDEGPQRDRKPEIDNDTLIQLVQERTALWDSP